jgi:phosphoserine aminotransferase
MKATFSGYYGQQITTDIDNEKTWETIQNLYSSTCPGHHNGTLVEIDRDDKGSAYNTPGIFTVKDWDNNTFTVVLS